jgi:hypothetical protein
MNKSSAFLAAFWAGLAAPASLYSAVPSYRPLIADLTFADSFALVGGYLAMAEADYVERSTATAEGTQLSFEFPPSA